MSTLPSDIETRIRATEPGVEVLLAEVAPGGVLRLFIDHPDGVTLALCERVSNQLGDLRDRYSLEVSSPGQDRPLTKPEHYRRYLGRRARVRLPAAAASRVHNRAPNAKRFVSVTGELVGASEQDVTIAASDGVLTIPFDEIVRSNLVPGD